jgi:hypothetical protein
MTAAEARQLTMENRKPPMSFTEAIDLVHERIRNAACKGLCAVGNPFGGTFDTMITPKPSREDAKRIYDRLKEEGYAVTFDIAASQIIEIRWNVKVGPS